jgi:hypothetical protein
MKAPEKCLELDAVEEPGRYETEWQKRSCQRLELANAG